MLEGAGGHLLSVEWTAARAARARAPSAVLKPSVWDDTRRAWETDPRLLSVLSPVERRVPGGWAGADVWFPRWEFCYRRCLARIDPGRRDFKGVGAVMVKTQGGF